MSERTTIGGTVYESVGSSNSNLLLKCNGTARIQWGNKLIDLIKNGKIASGGSSDNIYIVSDSSDITTDGVYVLDNGKSLQLWVSKKGEQYNLTGTDLYISTTTKQDLTVEQRKQALENIGMYFNTFAELQESGIQNGIVYVVSEKKLYTIAEGVITEFEATLKTVTVEKEENNEGDIINSNVKIILSVLDSEFIVVGNGQVLVNYPLRLRGSARIESENASDTLGYRLYVDALGSHLDVDYINARNEIQNGIPITSAFSRGMIIMHSGDIAIPEGWAICDGQEHDYQGETVKTPNLIGKFIKAVGTVEECVEGGSSQITLTSENLPSHSHTYEAINVDSASVILQGEGSSVTVSNYKTLNQPTSTVGEGTPITIDPTHYGLIFIMKL